MIPFIIVFFTAFISFHLSTRKYLNPFKLIMVFGKKGSGKSTLLNRWCIEHHKKGWKIYASEDMPFANVFDPREMGKISFPAHSLIVIDEVSLLWDNRKFKDFPEEFSEWLRLQRHYQCKMIIASQSFDCDKRLRDLSDALYLVQNKFRVFTWAKKIRREITLTDASVDGKGESRIVDNLVFESILGWAGGSRILTFIPKYAKCFDSFKAYRTLPPVQVLRFIPGTEPTPFKIRLQHTFDKFKGWSLRCWFRIYTTLYAQYNKLTNSRKSS